MFNRTWFIKHQRKLLWLLNTPLVNIWFRWILRINGQRSSVGKEKILFIVPHAIFWAGKGNREFVAEFRTHNKFSKRIFYAFKPFWYTLHYWDMIFANKLMPEWNLGFDTLTAYPDPDPETDTVDGRVGRVSVDEAFGTIRAGAGSIATPSTATNSWTLHGSTTSDQYQGLSRLIWLFKTSDLTASAIIGAGGAILSVMPSDPISGVGLNDGTSVNSAMVIVSSNPATNTNLVNADYGTLGTTEFGRTAKQSLLTANVYADVTLNASGISNISLIGISKFGGKHGWDADNTTTGLTWVSEGFQAVTWYAADTAATTSDPKLVITYTLAAGGRVPGEMMMMGVGR